MKLYNKSQISWISYDFANSAFHLLIPTILFPLFFKKALFVNVENTDLIWSIVVSIPILLSALFAPFIGVYMDKKQKMKIFFNYVTILTILMCLSLGIVSIKQIFFSITIFMLGMFFFNLSQFSYNSFLPTQKKKEGSALLSGIGWGLGYFGGILCMIPVLSIIDNAVLPNDYKSYQYSFFLVGIFYLIFAIPSLLFMKTQTTSPLNKVDKQNNFKDVFDALINWKDNKNILKFLIANNLQ